MKSDELLDYFDGNCWGQRYWDYHGDDMDAPLMQMLVRSYPVAVAGKIIRYGRSEDKMTFSLEYESETEGETLIYAHRPFEAETNGKAEVKQKFFNGASLISLTASAGVNYIKLTFKD